MLIIILSILLKFCFVWSMVFVSWLLYRHTDHRNFPAFRDEFPLLWLKNWYLRIHLLQDLYASWHWSDMAPRSYYENASQQWQDWRWSGKGGRNYIYGTRLCDCGSKYHSLRKQVTEVVSLDMFIHSFQNSHFIVLLSLLRFFPRPSRRLQASSAN